MAVFAVDMSASALLSAFAPFHWICALVGAVGGLFLLLFARRHFNTSIAFVGGLLGLCVSWVLLMSIGASANLNGKYWWQITCNVIPTIVALLMAFLFLSARTWAALAAGGAAGFFGGQAVLKKLASIWAWHGLGELWLRVALSVVIGLVVVFLAHKFFKCTVSVAMAVLGAYGIAAAVEFFLIYYASANEKGSGCIAPVSLLADTDWRRIKGRHWRCVLSFVLWAVLAIVGSLYQLLYSVEGAQFSHAAQRHGKSKLPQHGAAPETTHIIVA